MKTNNWSSFVIGGKGDKKKLNSPNPGDGWDPCYFLTLDSEYNYIRYIFPNRIEELYDLEADPKELDNLAINPEYQDKLKEMREELIAYLKNTGGESFVDLLPKPKADYSTVTPEFAEEDVPIPGDTQVYYNEGKKRVHIMGCRRLPTDKDELAAFKKMTFSQAAAKGLPPCSRCPGSTTTGKGNPE